MSSMFEQDERNVQLVEYVTMTQLYRNRKLTNFANVFLLLEVMAFLAIKAAVVELTSSQFLLSFFAVDVDDILLDDFSIIDVDPLGRFSFWMLFNGRDEIIILAFLLLLRLLLLLWQFFLHFSIPLCRRGIRFNLGGCCDFFQIN